MHILVLVKQVPDTKIIKMNPKTNTMDRSSAPAIMNPYDTYAVEEAVRLKEKYGGKVSILSMGPPPAVATLKKCVEMGADETYLISDRAFAGADTLATSYALGAAINKIAEKTPVDMVIAGKQSIDGDTGQVGPGVARRMNIPTLTFVQKVVEVNCEKKKVRVHRKREDGYEVVETSLPCLLTVEKGINEPRYATLPNMIKGARHQPVVWAVSDLQGVDTTQLGLKGSPTVVGKVWVPTKTGEAEMYSGTADEMIVKMTEILIGKRHLIAKGGR